MSALLTVHHVSLNALVGQGSILREVSFAVQSGEFVALLGPSGSGKSSLLKLLNRLRSPASGSIEFRGQPVAKSAVTELRRQITLVGQDTRLLGMTVEAALHYPLLLQKLPEVKRRQRVAECVSRFHLPLEWLDKTELELSGGQQQLVAIARALILEPTLLLLDEPTSALDLGTATRLLNNLKAQVKNHGLSIIMSNHQLELAEKFCDRVLYLQGGQLLKNQLTSETDWQELRQLLIEANTQNESEWGDDDFEQG